MHKLAWSLVYSEKKFTLLSVAVFATMLFTLSMVSQFIFLSPILIFHVPTDSIPNFIMIIVISALSAIVVSMTIFRIRISKGWKRSSPGLAGSAIGASAGACSSCSSFGFAIVSTFGTAGSTFTSLLTNYETPLRVVSIVILCVTYVYAVRGITKECKIVK